MYRNTLKQNPLDGYIYANLGFSYLKLNNVEASLKMYRIAKKLLEQKSYTYTKYINSIIEKIHNNL
jgi:cytochrome c-type biogenesis protein CcmH/NrfG